MNPIKTLALVSLMVMVSSAVLAHGDEDHAKKTGTVKKEQKAWGIAGDAKAAGTRLKTIELTMTDNMRFTPDRIDVKQSDTVKLVFRNNGAQLHEFVLGTKKELEEHAALMLKFPTMEHDEPYMAHVKAGEMGQIVWKFNRAGDFDFACLIAGHYQAGMVGKIKVVNAAALSKVAYSPPRTSDPSDFRVAQATGTEAGELTDGEVRKIDKDSGKLTLKHGEIKNLDMPGMTMVFVVKDKAMLDKLQPGDKIKFKAINDTGKFTITEIMPAK